MKDHEAYLKSMTTSRSLRKLQSTIAGAGGTTMTEYRIDRERHQARLEREEKKLAAEAEREVEKTLQAKEEEARQLEAQRREKKRLKKKKQRAKRGRESSGSEEESDEDVKELSAPQQPEEAKAK